MTSLSHPGHHHEKEELDGEGDGQGFFFLSLDRPLFALLSSFFPFLSFFSFFPRASAKGFFVKSICRTTSHLHLHIFTSAHLHFHILTSARLHPCSSSHLHIHISAHLHIFTSAHLHICTSTSSHLHICTSTSSHLHIFTSASHICGSSRSSFLSLLRRGGAAGAPRNATLCGDRARRGREMQVRLRFGFGRRNPLRRSRASRAQNAGEIAFWIWRAELSAEIARVEGAKCR